MVLAYILWLQKKISFSSCIQYLSEANVARGGEGGLAQAECKLQEIRQ